MFQLHDLRESKVWQEAHEEGKEESRTMEKEEVVKRMVAMGKTLKEIAKVLDISLAEVRRLACREK